MWAEQACLPAILVKNCNKDLAVAICSYVASNPWHGRLCYLSLSRRLIRFAALTLLVVIEGYLYYLTLSQFSFSVRRSFLFSSHRDIGGAFREAEKVCSFENGGASVKEKKGEKKVERGEQKSRGGEESSKEEGSQLDTLVEQVGASAL